MNNSALNNSTSSPGTFRGSNFTSNDSISCDSPGTTYNAALIAIYAIVLMGGSAGAVIMTWKIKSDGKSATSTAVINLISVHTFFLLTVPFRISYYILGEWRFGEIFCKLVSAMIHVHMYLCFMFYVAIVVIRMISFFREKKRMQFYQPWHASAASLLIWALVLLGVLPLFLSYFDSSEQDGKKCFQFTTTTASQFLQAVNGLAVITVLTTFSVLLTIQAGQQTTSATEMTEQPAVFTESPCNSSDCNQTQSCLHDEYKSALIGLYSIVFVGGIIGACVTIHRLLKSDKNSKSFIIINLSVAHVIFLITVPFRISYYVMRQWKFGLVFCKLVSAVIHIHIYLTFVFYVIIITTRFINVFQKRENPKVHRLCNALVLSVVLWFVVTVVIFPIFFNNYGVNHKYDENLCFCFEAEISSTSVRIVNYILIYPTICTVIIMLICQIGIMLNLAVKHGSQTCVHQVFRAQLKTLAFILIMFMFFVPYLGFRIYYIKGSKGNSPSMHSVNEIGLSITGMSCFDLLIFWIWYSF
ncbi:probable G-protein coupled receptor 34 [Heterodontus francisci]|uniref:probable G-protein coupled receptor 34 n=1 Tax=Heterodontus francisci TaxID=7792 RepID=UPI00355B0A3E